MQSVTVPNILYGRVKKDIQTVMLLRQFVLASVIGYCEPGRRRFVQRKLLSHLLLSSSVRALRPAEELSGANRPASYPLCPECSLSPYSVRRLFSGPSSPTYLIPMYLWRRPHVITAFLSPLPYFDLPRSFSPSLLPSASLLLVPFFLSHHPISVHIIPSPSPLEVFI